MGVELANTVPLKVAARTDKTTLDKQTKKITSQCFIETMVIFAITSSPGCKHGTLKGSRRLDCIEKGLTLDKGEAISKINGNPSRCGFSGARKNSSHFLIIMISKMFARVVQIGMNLHVETLLSLANLVLNSLVLVYLNQKFYEFANVITDNLTT